jgi:protein-disulfide isomerase
MSIRGWLEGASSVVVILVGLVWLFRTSAPAPAGSPREEAPLPTTPISLDGALLAGSQSASVALVEFADYECRFCGRFSRESLSNIRRAFIDTGRALFVFRNYPLGPNANAKPAAIAADCAIAAGQGWTMHNLLFAEPTNLARERLLAHGRSLGLREPEFVACLDSEERLRKVEADATYAKSLGVRVTPTFFVGRLSPDGVVATTRITGAKEPELVEAIETALKAPR